MHSNITTNSHEGGFTIIEVLIFTLLISLILTTLVGVTMTALQRFTSAQQLLLGNQYAEEGLYWLEIASASNWDALSTLTTESGTSQTTQFCMNQTLDFFETPSFQTFEQFESQWKRFDETCEFVSPVNYSFPYRRYVEFSSNSVADPDSIYVTVYVEWREVLQTRQTSLQTVLNQ